MLPTRVLSRLILPVFIIAFSWQAGASAQTENTKAMPFTDFMRMFAEQPDHIADWEFVTIEEKLGVNLTERIRLAKKQGQLRQEFYPLASARGVSDADKRYKVVCVLKPNQPGLAFDPQMKTYAQMPDGFNAMPLDVEQVVRNAERSGGKVKVRRVGTVSVDGHETAKMAMTIESEGNAEIFFYFASDLKGLLIRMDTGVANGTHLTVSNISLDVPDELFLIPEGYRQVDFDTFMRPLKQKVPAAQANQRVTPVDPRTLPQGIPGPPPSAKTTPPGFAADQDVPPVAARDVDVEPVLLNLVKPGYTEEARQNRIKGIVKARLYVNAAGQVMQVRITAGLPDGLNEEAVKAAYQCRYKPAMKKGKPVARWVNAEFEFTLEDK